MESMAGKDYSGPTTKSIIPSEQMDVYEYLSIRGARGNQIGLEWINL
jgi:hypothetical protein